MQWARTNRAFTIVELLIVIVVIAILAAITVVAYTGIQERARNTQAISGVNQYYKAFLAYKSLNGQYPSAATNGHCLGAGYPGDRCWDGPNGVRIVNATLDNELATVMNAKPVLATARLPIGNGTDDRAGLIYVPASGTDAAYFRWYLAGTTAECGLAGAQRTTPFSTLTNCVLDLP